AKTAGSECRFSPRGLAYDLRRVAERLTVRHLALKANSAPEVDLEINRKKAAAESPALNAIRALKADRILNQKDLADIPPDGVDAADVAAVAQHLEQSCRSEAWVLG